MALWAQDTAAVPAKPGAQATAAVQLSPAAQSPMYPSGAAVSVQPIAAHAKGTKSVGTDKTVAEWLAEMTPAMRTLFDTLEGYLTSLGDDVQRKDLKIYIAFKRLRNFITVCFQKNNLSVYLHVDPDQVDLVAGFTRDVRNIGHWGTGNVEVTLKNLADLDKAKLLILKAYEGSSHAG